MRILQVHNFYRQPGGEDRVFADEYGLLVSRGHFVRQYSMHNDSIGRTSGIRVAARTVWNQESYREVRRLVKHESLDIVHAHNTFPIVSPAIYYAADAEKVPVVQTLHNYRLLCPAATLFRNGRVCEQCLGSLSAYPAIVHRCYRGSLPASAVASAMGFAHRVAGTWNSRISAYIALTDFSRDKFIEGGLPAGRIKVKPNFLLNDPGVGAGSGGYALFVGRLSVEKGLDTLLKAWKTLGDKIPLKIAGDGPMRQEVERLLGGLKGVEYLGRCEHSRIIELLKEAAFLVFPSEWYEAGTPLTVIEALACGTPVVISALDSMNESILEGVTGFRFATGDASGLVSCVEDVLRWPALASIRASARIQFEQRYTPDRNYQTLMQIYQDALERPGCLLSTI
jgi:glycosyltransferase involved in cell wall biosynthesis